MEDLKTKLYVNKDQGLKTLVKVYYAGHGAMRNMTYCVTTDPKKQYYPLENMLMKLSQTENSFVFGIFDCCRDPIKEEQKQATRGGGGESKLGEEELDQRETNCMFMYRVYPNKTAAVSSVFSQALFQ